MKRLLLSVSVLMAMAINVFAQNDVDAFLFSQSNWEGTARFVGAGGAFSAIGGDYSTISTNPAGIGLYKKTEISFTPLVVTAFKTTADYRGESTTSNRVRYSLSNFGSVLSCDFNKDETQPSSKWRRIQFGFGYNRINDFNSITNAMGMGNGSSISTALVNVANGTSYKNIEGDALCAWNTWLIDTMPGETSKYREYLAGNSLYQNYYCKTSGGIDEMSFTLGGNYNDHLFIGLTVGVPFLNYSCESEYLEDDKNDVVSNFEKVTVYDKMRTTGVGVNAKIGLIYQPTSFLRLGAAFHTPTYYGNLRESFDRQFITKFSDDGSYDYAYDNVSKYKLSTPLRAIGSVGFIIAKRAFISAEYEFTDYSMATLQSSDNIYYRYNFKDENLATSKNYGASHGVRVGAELTVTDNFLIRVGYGYNTSPYKDNTNNAGAHTASGGIGFRGKVFFCDFAYQYRHYGQNFWFYQDEALEPTTVTTNSHRFLATVGVKF